MVTSVLCCLENSSSSRESWEEGSFSGENGSLEKLTVVLMRNNLPIPTKAFSVHDIVRPLHIFLLADDVKFMVDFNVFNVDSYLDNYMCVVGVI